ncbi:hypothetical protein QR680_002318 [Steinernema hermaphroditum]|uniref:Uncharacterized protein n=1 Tax=Steinernema hermaphroditum TaxID=289476 RepID=A0AA39H2A1_9BILA|nr:hypothetical protein QR680_002318 [Steinernema hermaphroditum]
MVIFCLLAFSMYLTVIPVGVSAKALLTSPPWASDTECPVYKNEALHVVMDRVCEMCHEMFSHQNSNMRVDCRAQCFRNDQFRSCLYLFKPRKS